MIDRSSRDALALALRAYLNDELTAFALDAQLDDLNFKDAALAWTASQLWMFYDDIRDHKVVLDKDGWDFLQRLLLVLDSDAEIAVERSGPRWLAWVWADHKFVPECAPFSNRTEIVATRKSVPNFRKQPYRAEIAARHIRSPTHNALMWALALPQICAIYTLKTLVQSIARAMRIPKCIITTRVLFTDSDRATLML